MTKNLTAKQRKQATAAKSQVALDKTKKPSGRRSGPMTSFISEKAKAAPKETKVDFNKAWIAPMGTPSGLSIEARFAELRPDQVHPIDWANLFTDDEALWEALVEVAIEAVDDGEIPRYPDDAPANVSRRKLQAAQNDQQREG